MVIKDQTEVTGISNIRVEKSETSRCTFSQVTMSTGIFYTDFCQLVRECQSSVHFLLQISALKSSCTDFCQFLRKCDFSVHHTFLCKFQYWSLITLTLINTDLCHSFRKYHFCVYHLFLWKFCNRSPLTMIFADCREHVIQETEIQNLQNVTHKRRQTY